jgi:uncharacterized protein YbbK (DUF523 family)
LIIKGKGTQQQTKIMNENFLVSACLIGEICRYDGKKKDNIKLIDALDTLGYKYIAVCPEVLGGLPTPRSAAQIQEGNGSDVLRGEAFVIDETGRNVTGNFIAGAKKVLKISVENNIKKAILNERSPSCGVNYIYKGIQPVRGAGVTTALLTENGIEVVSDEDFLKAYE